MASIAVTQAQDVIVFPDDRRTSGFPSLAKEGWRAAPGWFGMSADQPEKLYPVCAPAIQAGSGSGRWW
jgi:hypothetical protein